MAAPAASWTGQARVKGSSEGLRMLLLTFSLVGLQFCWGTEQTYVAPYLLALGISKSRMSLVWAAGPLSGLIMQPVVGMISDKCKSKYGRRRPFMVGGALATATCFVILGWTGEIVGVFVSDMALRREATVALAVLDIYVLDFMINIVQSTCRSLIVDTLPVAKQQLGSAWASRMVGVGHLLVFAIGALDLNATLGPTLLGDTQFKKVCLIAALAFLIAVGVTCCAVQERVLVTESTKPGETQTVLSLFAGLYHTMRELPERIQAICWVQFWSWIGWFPFLFYGSTWVGEIYLRYDAPHVQHETGSDAVSDVGRIGSQAFILFSFVSFAGALGLPWLVKGPEDEGKPGFTPRPPRSLETFLKPVHLGKLSLLTSWACANLLFAASMVFAPLVQSVHFATILVALCGMPWAIAGYASFAMIGIEINRLGSQLPATHSRTPSYRRLSTDSTELDSHDGSRILHLRNDSNISTAPVATSTGELAGVYLGILNVYTTLPQFVGTAISMIVFTILEPGKSPELAKDAHPDEHHSTAGPNGIGVCLFIGALCALMAAWATRRLKVE